ncbi:uncharacterized protein LOC107359465 isoform X2 [Tetranychus urticae]|uniref:C3H1-type domain-containing protein n=1 Tax=Tetranychus urticae TaxID=32264 RepID=T1K311_TETUR|nr:uncharacterized protein LOC107359465 isoform X2 [Tetranychus urticae]XP_015781427.1 uncharacterized protein LOC107359465 isoform X2 [Tetranychus urticae]
MAHTVCTYDGDFHCDQVFACYLIKKLLHVKPNIIRTQDSAIIGKSDFVIGVGSVYDHNKQRYDHHHLDLTLKSLDPSKPFKIKLSCAGLVYHHYGRDVIAKILGLTEPCFKDEVEALFDVIYENFVQEIDAMANRTAICEGEPNFKIGTDLTSRINRLRSTNSLDDTENDLAERFIQAIILVGSEFEDITKYYGNIWLPAKTFVEEALLNCKKVHSSGAIIDLSQSGEMPWIEHLINIERELNIEGQIKFAILYDVSGIWRLSCVPVSYSLSELRIPFHSHWYGLSQHKLCDITGVPGCICIHPLIGDFETKEACIAIAEKMLQLNAEKHLNLNKSNSLSDGSFYSLTENLSIEEKLNEAYEQEETDEDPRKVSASSINHVVNDNWVDKIGVDRDAENDNFVDDQDQDFYPVELEGSIVNKDVTIQSNLNKVKSGECEELTNIIDSNNYTNENYINADENEYSDHDDKVVQEYLETNEEGEGEVEEEEEEAEGEEGEEEELYEEECDEFDQPEYCPISHLITILENGCHLYSIPPPSLPLAEYHFCVVSALVDPSEFYIHLSNDDSNQLDDIQEQLSNHFAIIQSDDFDLPDDPNLLIDSCWAAIYPTDNEWCRVRVIDLIHSEEDLEEDSEAPEDIRSRKILVKYIDYGTEEVIVIGDLKPLPIDLINIPAYAVRCRLSHIYPPSEGWSIECLRYFEDLTGIKIEQMVTVYVTERPSKNNYEEPLSVFLWFSDSALGQGKDILVNAALVKASYALTDSMDWVLEADAQSIEETPEIHSNKFPVATCSQVKSNSIDFTSVKRSSSMSAIEEEIPDDWDPMKEDHRALTNTYAFDPSDTGTAILGYKSGDLDKVCQHFLSGYCKYGESCVYKHLKNDQMDSLDTEEVLIDTFQSELVKVGMSLKAIVTECLSPYSLYVKPTEDIFLEQNFESRVGAHYDFIDPTLENYLNLTKEMTDFYRRAENKENFLIYPAIGSLVAARSDSVFFRGRVIDMSYDEDELHIMNIDTGVELMVDRREVLSLKPKFATLPPAAVHCAVDVPQGISITDQVMNDFSDLVLHKRFRVQFVDKDMEGRYKINLFNLDGEPFVIDWDLL